MGAAIRGPTVSRRDSIRCAARRSCRRTAGIRRRYAPPDRWRATLRPRMPLRRSNQPKRPVLAAGSPCCTAAHRLPPASTSRAPDGALLATRCRSPRRASHRPSRRQRLVRGGMPSRRTARSLVGCRRSEAIAWIEGRTGRRRILASGGGSPAALPIEGPTGRREHRAVMVGPSDRKRRSGRNDGMARHAMRRNAATPAAGSRSPGRVVTRIGRCHLAVRLAGRDCAWRCVDRAARAKARGRDGICTARQRAAAA